MKNKKIITMQDISCYGQCSITVALPILSAYGFETAILPSAILSTHTAGFKDFFVHDLSDDLPKIIAHWKKEGIKYDVLYSGYLGDNRHFEYLLDIKKNLMNKGSLFVIDPVMGDHGKLYPAFGPDYVKHMKAVLKEADIILPNLTEACFLANKEYKEEYDEAYIKDIIAGLKNVGAKTVVLTGVSYEKGKTGVVIDDGKYQYYCHDKINTSFHGTGDVYSSSFIGMYLKTNDLFYSAKCAADFVVECIKKTIGDDSHLYGVKFESLLADFVAKH
ncbi:MAG: pyridoxamine kinase [Bacilli bacterium]|nr:pyridoxamine kinase [Bacilli bacterium]